MIAIDPADLEKPHPLDDEQECFECSSAVINTAHTLARGSNAQTFCLLLTAVGHFAAGTDMQRELLELGITTFKLALEDLGDSVDVFDHAALDAIPPHDPTGSPIDGALQFVMGNGLPTCALDADEQARAYEAERAADPDPRDEDDLETGGASC